MVMISFSFFPSNALKYKFLNHGDFFDAHSKRGSQKFESALVHFLSQNFYSNKGGCLASAKSSFMLFLVISIMITRPYTQWL